MSTRNTNAAPAGASARLDMMVLLCLLAALAAPASAPRAAPLTPWDVAPQTYTGNTQADSMQSHLASCGNLAHRPIALATTVRGIEMASSGKLEEAWGAWELARSYDPSYPTPALAAARFGGTSAPAGVLRALTTLPEALVNTFSGQQSTAANLLILTFFPLLIALVATGLLVFARHAPRLHHLWWEHLQALLPRSLAKWAVWGIALLPLFWNFGGLLWVGLILMASYPLLRKSERRLALALVAALLITPFGIQSTSILLAPADPAHPVSALARAQQYGALPEIRSEIQTLQANYPEEGALYYSEALLARQAGDLPVARTLLEKAQTMAPLPQPRFDAAWGIQNYREGNVEESIRRLSAAADGTPDRFGVRYNLSKAYARASLFLKADREMHQAFRLNAGRVRLEEQRRLHEKASDLIEERLASTDLWRILFSRQYLGNFQVPRPLSYLFPGGNPSLLYAGLVLLPVMLFLAIRWHRHLRIHTCCQCGQSICRRCLKRHDRRVFCPGCAVTASKWASAQYTQILLTKLLGRHDRLRDRFLDVARFLIPGLGAVLRGQIAFGFFQTLMVAGAVLWIAEGGLPVKPLPWSALEDSLLPVALLPAFSLALVYGWIARTEHHGIRKRTSLKQFLAPTRSRSTQPKAA